MRLGNTHVNNRGDFTIKIGKQEHEGEAFNASPSFFSVKLYNTLKSKKIEDLRYVLFNQEAVTENPKCETYLRTKERQNPKVLFLPVVWDK